MSMWRFTRYAQLRAWLILVRENCKVVSTI